MPGVVKGSKPRRTREMVTSVVSKIVTARINTGASQADRYDAFSKRNFRPNVAIKNPRNMAPPSPMKILAGLKFQRKNPVAAPRTAAARMVTNICPFR